MQFIVVTIQIQPILLHLINKSQFQVQVQLQRRQI